MFAKHGTTISAVCALTKSPPAWSTCRYDHGNISSGSVFHCARPGRPQHESEPFQPPGAYIPAGKQDRGRNNTQRPHGGNAGYVTQLFPVAPGNVYIIAASQTFSLFHFPRVGLLLHMPPASGRPPHWSSCSRMASLYLADLCELAGLEPIGVLCEIALDDGRMVCLSSYRHHRGVVSHRYRDNH